MKKILISIIAVLGVTVFSTNSLSAQCDKMGNGKSCCAKTKACCDKDKECKDIKTLSKVELTKLIQSGKAIVFDARTNVQFKDGHINGALNYGVDKLPSNKNQTIIFYCGGPKCPLSTQVAKEVKEKGYKKVMVYKGGWSDWSKKV
ncbi:MAG: rhodanese-like domain-containing protein [Chlorobiota bacterium]|jgi:rhodanese-related sulfurtransferase|nr:rhodanese-like domain-containing protein [Chlorobiota bacterium]QQS66398.1 MAG: rhodanese-like domain-containing protein [Chlorobiota bacterium]